MSISLPNGPERRLVESINGWQYAPAPQGVYYVPAPTSSDGTFELRFLDSGTGQSRLLETIRAAYFGNGLSVSPTGAVLMNGVTSIDVDLMMIENFR